MIAVIKILALLLLMGLILFACYKTISYTQRNLGSFMQTKRALIVTRVGLLIVGGIVGIFLSSITLRISTSHAIVGLPLPWAIWEIVNGRWEDFASPVSLVPWITDFIFGLALSHLPMAAWVLRKSRHVSPGAI